MLRLAFLLGAFLPLQTVAFSPRLVATSPTVQLFMASTQESMKEESIPSAQPLIVPSDAKYPTMRGSTTDSRKIISTFGRQHLTAVRLRHILFATEELAQSTLHKLRAGDILFEELATQLSACSETREKGGEIGWVSVTDSASSLDASAILDEAHLDPLLPSAARETVIQITTKPGDIISVQSERGFHLVQVVDIMADVRKMASIRKPRAKRTEHQPPDKLTGVLSGALNNDNVDLTYKLETMGCQMNMADSERIEGQLQALGIRPFDEDVNENSKKGPDVVVLNTCRYVKDSKSVRKSLLCNR